MPTVKLQRKTSTLVPQEAFHIIFYFIRRQQQVPRTEGIKNIVDYRSVIIDVFPSNNLWPWPAKHAARHATRRRVANRHTRNEKILRNISLAEPG